MTAGAQTLKLTGNRCRCPACGEHFNGTAGFDFHRVGEHGVNRRCLTVAEMTAKGYGRNTAGFWVTDSHAQRAARRTAGGVSGARAADPVPTASVSAHAAALHEAGHGRR